VWHGSDADGSELTAGATSQDGNCEIRVQFPLRIMTQTSFAPPASIHFRSVYSLGKSATDERLSKTALKAPATLDALALLCSGNS